MYVRVLPLHSCRYHQEAGKGMMETSKDKNIVLGAVSFRQGGGVNLIREGEKVLRGFFFLLFFGLVFAILRWKCVQMDLDFSSLFCVSLQRHRGPRRGLVVLLARFIIPTNIGTTRAKPGVENLDCSRLL